MKEGSAGPAPPILPPSACHLKILYAHWEMIEGLERRYRVEECPSIQSSAPTKASTDCSDSINGSDYQKFVGSETGCEHNHVYLMVLDPGACLPVLVIHPELFDCFSKRQISHEVFDQPV